MDNPKTLVTLGMHAQNEDKQNTKSQYRKLKGWATRTQQKSEGEPEVLSKGKQFLSH